MTAKSIFLTAAAAAGMVAVADVWDIKFTLKTVQNDKKVSMTLKGAWDDAVDGQYSFWDNKTKVALKNVAFLTAGSKAYSNGRNQGSNAQLVWGGLENPEGLLVAGGFGSLKSQSGQVVGTYGGAPASGTWSMKKASARKTFDSLNKGGSVDAKANAALKKEAEFVLAEALKDDSATSETTKKIEDLTAQVATAQEAAKAAEAKVAAAEKAAADANARAAGADEATKKAEEATAAAEKAKEDLAKAVKEKEDLEKELASVTDVSSNTGLALTVKKIFRTEIQNLLSDTVEKTNYEVAALDKNVTNAVLDASNRLATARESWDEAITKYSDMIEFDNKTYENISFSNELEYVDLPELANRKDDAWRAPVEGALKDELDFTIAGSAADTWTNAYIVLTQQLAKVEAKQKEVDAAQDAFNSAGEADRLAAQTALNARKDELAALNKYIEDNELREKEADALAAYNDAKAELAKFQKKEDITELEAKIAKKDADLKKFIDECGAYTVKAFHDDVMPAQKKVRDDLADEVADLEAKMAAYKTKGIITDWVDPTPVYKYYQDKWDDEYKTEVSDKQKGIDNANERIAAAENNLKTATDLAKVLGAESELIDDEWVKGLQTAYAPALANKKVGPLVVEAAAKWGVTLKTTY